MPKVKILTHSGCDLTEDMVRELDIRILPDLVAFGSENYLNNVDIHPEEFYERIDKSGVFPSSAHPTLSDFIEAFEQAGDCDEILCIVMSSKMTSTVNTANIAAKIVQEDNPGRKIYVYDSMQVSFGMGLAVLEAGKLAREGRSAAEIMAYLDTLVPHIGVYFVMRSLKYAHKGGRIGAIKAVGADALGVKPLLSFADGTVSDIKLNRRFSDGIREIFNCYKNRVGDDPEVFIFHACNEADARKLEQMILDYNPNAKTRIHWVGPVVGIYTGVGCVGISFKEKEN